MKIEIHESKIDVSDVYLKEKYPHTGLFYNTQANVVIYVSKDFVIYVAPYDELKSLEFKQASEEMHKQPIKFEQPIGVPLHRPHVSEEFALKMVALLKGQKFEDLV